MRPASRFAKVDSHPELVGIQIKMKSVGFGVTLLAAKGTPSALGRPNSWWLNLDNLRSEISEQLASHGGSQKRHRVEAREFNHLNTVKRECAVHHYSSSHLVT